MDLTMISSGILSFVLMLFATILIGSIIIFVYYSYRKKKRYDFLCVILEQDGFGQSSYQTDKAGVYVDNKTKNKRFFLKRNNVGLDPDDIPYIRDEKGKKTIFLRKDGLKNFRYIDFKTLFTGDNEITVGEEDVNWAINAYERQKSVFGSTTLQKLLPYIGLIIMGVFILGMVAVILSKIPALLEETTKLTQVLKEMYLAQSGTTVI